LKAVGRQILLKTERGAVTLDLMGESAVRSAYRDMSERLAADMTGAIVQRMVDDGIEMLAGAVQDASFGPVIACGAGGTLVELLSDVVFRLPPLTDIDARTMVDEMKGARLLRGYRGSAPVDEQAFCDALVRLSMLIEWCPEIQEIDINPLKVLPHGVCAVDARIRVERPHPVRSRRILY